MLRGFFAHPLMLINFLLLLPIIFSSSPLLKITALFSLSAIGPPLLYWTTMQARSTAPMPERLLRLAALVAMGTGLAVAGREGLATKLLPIWYDVDAISDLQRLQTDLASAPRQVAQHTRRFLEKLA